MKRPESVNLLEKPLPISTPARCDSTADPFLDMSQYYMLMFISTASISREGKMGRERESQFRDRKRAWEGSSRFCSHTYENSEHSVFVKGDVSMKCICTLKTHLIHLSLYVKSFMYLHV